MEIQSVDDPQSGPQGFEYNAEYNPVPTSADVQTWDIRESKKKVRKLLSRKVMKQREQKIKSLKQWRKKVNELTRRIFVLDSFIGGFIKWDVRSSVDQSQEIKDRIRTRLSECVNHVGKLQKGHQSKSDLSQKLKVLSKLLLKNIKNEQQTTQKLQDQIVELKGQLDLRKQAMSELIINNGDLPSQKLHQLFQRRMKEFEMGIPDNQIDWSAYNTSNEDHTKLRKRSIETAREQIKETSKQLSELKKMLAYYEDIEMKRDEINDGEAKIRRKTFIPSFHKEPKGVSHFGGIMSISSKKSKGFYSSTSQNFSSGTLSTFQQNPNGLVFQDDPIVGFQSEMMELTLDGLENELQKNNQIWQARQRGYRVIDKIVEAFGGNMKSLGTDSQIVEKVQALLEDDNKDINTEVRFGHDNIRKVLKDNKSLEHKYDRLERDLKRANEDNVKVVKQRDSLVEEIETLRKAKPKTKTVDNDLVQKHRVETHRLQLKIRKIERELKQKERELHALSKFLRKAETEKKQKKVVLAKMAEMKENDEEMIKKFEAEEKKTAKIKNKEIKIEALEKSVAERNEVIGELVKERDSKIFDLEEIISHLTREKTVLQRKLTEVPKQRHPEPPRGRMEDARGRMEDARRRIEDGEERIHGNRRYRGDRLGKIFNKIEKVERKIEETRITKIVDDLNSREMDLLGIQDELRDVLVESKKIEREISRDNLAALAKGESSGDLQEMGKDVMGGKIVEKVETVEFGIQTDTIKEKEVTFQERKDFFRKPPPEALGTYRSSDRLSSMTAPGNPNFDERFSKLSWEKEKVKDDLSKEPKSNMEGSEEGDGSKKEEVVKEDETIEGKSCEKEVVKNVQEENMLKKENLLLKQKLEKLEQELESARKSEERIPEKVEESQSPEKEVEKKEESKKKPNSFVITFSQANIERPVFPKIEIVQKDIPVAPEHKEEIGQLTKIEDKISKLSFILEEQLLQASSLPGSRLKSFQRLPTDNDILPGSKSFTRIDLLVNEEEVEGEGEFEKVDSNREIFVEMESIEESNTVKNDQESSGESEVKIVKVKKSSSKERVDSGTTKVRKSSSKEKVDSQGKTERTSPSKKDDPKVKTAKVRKSSSKEMVSETEEISPEKEEEKRELSEIERITRKYTEGVKDTPEPKSDEETGETLGENEEIVGEKEETLGEEEIGEKEETVGELESIGETKKVGKESIYREPDENKTGNIDSIFSPPTETENDGEIIGTETSVGDRKDQTKVVHRDQQTKTVGDNGYQTKTVGHSEDQTKTVGNAGDQTVSTEKVKTVGNTGNQTKTVGKTSFYRSKEPVIDKRSEIVDSIFAPVGHKEESNEEKTLGPGENIQKETPAPKVKEVKEDTVDKLGKFSEISRRGQSKELEPKHVPDVVPRKDPRVMEEDKRMMKKDRLAREKASKERGGKMWGQKNQGDWKELKGDGQILFTAQQKKRHHKTANVLTDKSYLETQSPAPKTPSKFVQKNRGASDGLGLKTVQIRTDISRPNQKRKGKGQSVVNKKLEWSAKNRRRKVPKEDDFGGRKALRKISRTPSKMQEEEEIVEQMMERLKEHDDFERNANFLYRSDSLDRIVERIHSEEVETKKRRSSRSYGRIKEPKIPERFDVPLPQKVKKKIEEKPKTKIEQNFVYHRVRGRTKESQPSEKISLKPRAVGFQLGVVASPKRIFTGERPQDFGSTTKSLSNRMNQFGKLVLSSNAEGVREKEVLLQEILDFKRDIAKEVFKLKKRDEEERKRLILLLKKSHSRNQNFERKRRMDTMITKETQTGFFDLHEEQIERIIEMIDQTLRNPHDDFTKFFIEMHAKDNFPLISRNSQQFEKLEDYLQPSGRNKLLVGLPSMKTPSPKHKPKRRKRPNTVMGSRLNKMAKKLEEKERRNFSRTMPKLVTSDDLNMNVKVTEEDDYLKDFVWVYSGFDKNWKPGTKRKGCKLRQSSYVVHNNLTPKRNPSTAPPIRVLGQGQSVSNRQKRVSTNFVL